MERLCQERPCCRHSHAPAFPAQALPHPSSTGDAQEAEPPQPSAPWHPWTPTWPRPWGSPAGGCHNPVPQFPPAVLSPSHSMGPSVPGARLHTLIPLPIPTPCPTKTNSCEIHGPTLGSAGPCRGVQSPRPHPSQGLPLPPCPGGCPCRPIPWPLSPCIHREPHRGFGLFGCLGAASGMPMVPPRRTRGILEAGGRGGRGQTSPHTGAPLSFQRCPLTAPSRSGPRDPPDPLCHPPGHARPCWGGTQRITSPSVSPSPARGGAGGSITGAGEGHTDHHPLLRHREAGAEGGPPDREPRGRAGSAAVI